ncbi:MAG TPA: hypothetical protein VGX25_33815 [Actinophytocola sp.]|uniref:WXG100 family type VII secretion target n=1 Tax=Actinophytocola sp. TaxID=1872138 RepID=UPI002DDCF0B3|nr:hypothetical protein [Actinophytocola sp.]HEV2784391.1 hypothetical protein [Actinophytocola sp.]
MTDGFTADADRLAAQAGQFPGLAERAGAIHRELSDALAETGACWGGDTVGQSFAAVHTGPADSTLGGLGALPDRLGSVGTRFADTATAYRDQDAAGARDLSAAGE